MNRILTFALAASLLGSAAAVAQPGQSGRYNQGRGGQDQGDQRGNGQDRYEQYRNDPGVRMSAPRWSRGDRVPDQYRGNQQYVVNDWQQRNLRRPPRGYHWVRDDNNNYFLAAVTTGVILDLLLNSR
jgi:Ni/Co efflux regulator RcnB